MRIGILTFHNSDNYGSVLQAYALKHCIESVIKDSCCEIVNYTPPNQKELYALYLPANSIKNITKNIRAFAFSKLLKNRRASFAEFRRSALGISLAPITEQDLSNNTLDAYDAVICGSDQIWNPRSQDFSIQYFLPNYSRLKIAYAPSFGNGQVDDFSSDEEKKKIRNLIEKFNAVSVREQAGIKFLKMLGIERKISLVLDPTLLLEQKEWDSLIQGKTSVKEEDKYIFFYSIDYNPEAVDMVKSISQKTGLKVKIMFSTNKTYGVLGRGFDLVSYTSPYDFIAMVKNSDLVLSTSFHGVAFSTIYRKKFYALETRRNGEIYVDERIHNLTDSFGITGRIIQPPDIEKIEWSKLSSIDYDETRIQKCREESIAFLYDNISGVRNG